MSSSPLQRAVSFDEDYGYESIGKSYDRYSVGSVGTATSRQSFLPYERNIPRSYQNYVNDVAESRYHSDQGTGRSRRDRFVEDRTSSHPFNNPKLRTGRQRKKAARVKHSEFQTVLVKRRLYFCCVSSEIDLTELESNLSNKYTTKVYGDALCISDYVYDSSNSPTNGMIEKRDSMDGVNSDMFDPTYQWVVFVFEFGTVVFWGVQEVGELILLREIRKYAKIGELDASEFESGEDDMAFIAASDETASITVNNDLLRIPDPCHLKELVAVSYAISQSTVLAIFEERIDRKVDEYKFIPETLSVKGKVTLPLDRVGMMIGDIFVIRHGLNLHSDILDTPDFFWDENKYKPNYIKMMSYLEMESRIQVLNKRLDMLKELLDMLQHQIHNAHATTLEWIVIWLIIIEVLIEVVGGGGALLGWWVW